MNQRTLRIVSWNLRLRVGQALTRQAALLRELAPDVSCLQEVNAHAIQGLRLEAGFSWLIPGRAVDSSNPGSRRSAYLAAVAGTDRLTASALPALKVPFPERIAMARITFEARDVVVSSYHAPPGASWGILKVEQARKFTDWLVRQRGSALLGADANTPAVDAIDFAETRTHWHTGRRILKGTPGDDVLWGPQKTHVLQDALRRWLQSHPENLESIRSVRPDGPLLISHRTGRRKGLEGTPRRFDSIWVSDDFAVINVSYLYAEALAAGSDHAVVVADVELRSPSEQDRSGPNHADCRT
jgi:endonuclease/exonuclease/phosphatase family metal-dependent hydrolase